MKASLWKKITLGFSSLSQNENVTHEKGEVHIDLWFLVILTLFLSNQAAHLLYRSHPSSCPAANWDGGWQWCSVDPLLQSVRTSTHCILAPFLL